MEENTIKEINVELSIKVMTTKPLPANRDTLAAPIKNVTTGKDAVLISAVMPHQMNPDDEYYTYTFRGVLTSDEHLTIIKKHFLSLLGEDVLKFKEIKSQIPSNVFRKNKV